MTRGVAGLAGHLLPRLWLLGPEMGTETPCQECEVLAMQVAPSTRVCVRSLSPPSPPECQTVTAAGGASQTAGLEGSMRSHKI